MDRDMEVRKCMALWNTGLPSREARETRVKKWVGAQIEKVLITAQRS